MRKNAKEEEEAGPPRSSDFHVPVCTMYIVVQHQSHLLCLVIHCRDKTPLSAMERAEKIMHDKLYKRAL